MVLECQRIMNQGEARFGLGVSPMGGDEFGLSHGSVSIPWKTQIKAGSIFPARSTARQSVSARQHFLGLTCP